MIGPKISKEKVEAKSKLSISYDLTARLDLWNVEKTLWTDCLLTQAKV